jgi:hypothetical protein
LLLLKIFDDASVAFGSLSSEISVNEKVEKGIWAKTALRQMVNRR